MTNEEERLPPLRRYRLYTRLADIFAAAEMIEAEDTARALAAEAIRESPELQDELRKILDALASQD